MQINGEIKRKDREIIKENLHTPLGENNWRSMYQVITNHTVYVLLEDKEITRDEGEY